MQKEWLPPGELSPDGKGQIEELTARLKCPPMIARLLWRKGLRDTREIEDFFDPKLEHQHDPFLFKDMEKAVGRILRAIEMKEKITIYGDYDVDGTTATTLLYLGLKSLGADIGFYIPNRMIDGYGLSLGSVDQIKEDGTSLIISVDCGVNALEEIEAINARGMEIIVTDHHNPKDELPQAYATINPKLPGSTYPFPHLAGVGVAYKLLMAIYERKGIRDEENAVKYLDLVAVGTIADIVPLTGENRVFASIGLRHLVAKKNLGLSALTNISGINSRSIDTSDIVFGIAPRINAAGRMGSASEAVELLISRDK
ncbi:MAG: single-stranded-DNA-specific exonuclease RecJ, partial [Candidatus Syntrophosphaera sp.]